MKTRTKIIISSLTAVICLTAGAFIYNALPGSSACPAGNTAAGAKINYSADKPVSIAEKLNGISADGRFISGVRRALDYYYGKNDLKSVSAFSKAIDSRADATLDNYRVASAERTAGSEKLGYSTGEICLTVKKDVSRAKLNALAKKYRGKCTDLTELTGTENLAVFKISLEYTVDKAAEKIKNENAFVEDAEPNNIYTASTDSSRYDPTAGSLSGLKTAAAAKAAETSAADAGYAANLGTGSAAETASSVSARSGSNETANSGSNETAAAGTDPQAASEQTDGAAASAGSTDETSADSGTAAGTATVSEAAAGSANSGSAGLNSSGLTDLSKLLSSGKAGNTAGTRNASGIAAQANDPFLPYQWGLTKISAAGAWNTETSLTASRLSSVRIAVIDTGCYLKHRDLQSNVNKKLSVQIYNGKQRKLSRIKKSLQDVSGHGTHVTGLIGATGNNGRGITGAATGAFNNKLNIIVIGTSRSKKGYMSEVDIIKAITYAKNKKCRIVNMSLGAYHYNSQGNRAIRKRIKSAVKKNIFFVCAAGNDSTAKKVTPGDYGLVTSVTALDRYGKRADYSNYGKAKDIAAPGGSAYDNLYYDVLSTFNGNKYAVMAGTSQAAPLVTSTAAMMLSVNRNLHPSQIRHILCSTTYPHYKTKSIYYGYGTLNTANAVFSVTTPTFTLAVTPETDPSVSTVTLTADPISGKGTTYCVVDSRTDNGAWTANQLIENAGMSRTFTGLSSGHTYQFRIRELNYSSSSDYTFSNYSKVQTITL